MPLILKRNLQYGVTGVWQIQETEPELRLAASAADEDEKIVESFKNESRRRQWYACRALLREMLELDKVKVDYDMHGRPSLREFKGDVSFSHTQDYAAVLVTTRGRAGIDIEKINPRIHRVAERFLQDDELEQVSRVTCRVEGGTCQDSSVTCHDSGVTSHVERVADHQSPATNNQSPITNHQQPATELLYLYWCAKEALYKFYGNPSVDLKNDIYIIAFDYFCKPETIFAARVKLPEGVEEHELRSERIGDHVLVYTL